ncbi:unnamed protein product [Cylicocyclus nassatus]|uniref:BED-type domain-containing protein n=1 Tax=Cylicocyclus nassatus TaxID=53992 RepID=A0AA36H352_CYLNA|nr:unnamed protein product [Cylicocyclus nassatus]
MDTAYLPTSYAYEDKDYFEQSVSVLPTPSCFQQPQHGHLYPIVPQPLPIQAGTQLTVEDDNGASSNGVRKRGTKRGRPTKNPVWTFFRRIDDKSVQCNMCARVRVVVTAYDHYQGVAEAQRTMPNVPWNPDRRGAKRNRRTKHPVWELFRRTVDGNAQCVLCNVVVRSPCSSNFMGHLNRHHSEHYQDIYNRWLEGRVDMPSLPS